MPDTPSAHTQLRRFTPEDLDALVAFWNRAFADQRNFHPLTAAEFRWRVLECPGFDPDGLILAWHTAGSTTRLVGLAHAFRPLPDHPVYERLGQGYREHTLALLYVEPEMRRQGIGSRLLKAAEDWLHYCPVYVAGHEQPCYGDLEGPYMPFFGSTQHLGISAKNLTLIRFLRNRGYRPADPGDISMQLDPLGDPPLPIPPPCITAKSVELRSFSHDAPYVIPKEIQWYAGAFYDHWLYLRDQPYAGYAVVTSGMPGMQLGRIAWVPMRRAGWAALVDYWLNGAQQGQGLGRYLLELALYEMAHEPPPRGGYRAVEVQTNYFNHPKALALYERQGFIVDEMWVSLVKR
ncbi:MAG: GNAT family N-acetyltransferase [Caldilineaceae bacterium]|nr:GNAT family N-acetyltransferase [Caldilineaceae bacterium]